MALQPYPTYFPSGEVITHLVPALRGQIGDAKETVHTCYHCIGYGLSFWDTHAPSIVGSGAGSLTDEQAADLLERASVSQGLSAVELLPWPILVPVLVELAKRLFDRLFSE